jgi:TolB-like protein
MHAAAALTASVCLAGCATGPVAGAQADNVVRSSYIQYTYNGADAIAVQVRSAVVSPVLVASLANVDQLDKSSIFGKISSDEIGSRLSQRGFLVVEARMRDVFVVKPGGEFMLSNEIRKIAEQQKAYSVLVGTYADLGSQALVSLKLIRISDSAVLAASDYVVPMSAADHSALLPSSVLSSEDSSAQSYLRP